MREPLPIQMGVGPSPPVEDLNADPSDEPLPIRFAKAVTLFLRGGAWTRDDHKQWLELTRSPLVLKSVITDMARQIIESEDKPNGQATGPAVRPQRSRPQAQPGVVGPRSPTEN
jgi:hypothetical protein